MGQIKRRGALVRSLRGSLALRILMIATVLVVFPLLFFTAVMYYEDSRCIEKDNLFTLELLLEEKRERIEQFIESESRLLALVEVAHVDQTKLKEVCQEGPFLALLHLIYGQESYWCDKASSPHLVGKNFSFQIPPESFQGAYLFGGRKEQEPLFLLYDPSSDEKELWAALVSKQDLTNKLTLDKTFTRQVAVFLLSQEGEVILSTAGDDRAQRGKGAFLSSKEEREGGVLYLKDEDEVGITQRVGKSNLFLLVTMPKHANFVSFPYLFAKMGVFLLIILIAGGGATLYLTFRLGKPLKILCKAMQQVKLTNDLKVLYVADRLGFEINVVGAIFNDMVESLARFIDRIREERAAKEAFERELMIGQEVQTSILPKGLPLFPGLDIAARFLSAKEVGGDFYDFLVRPGPEGERLFFVVADTAGKGIYACFYSLTIRSMLRSYSQVFDRLERVLQETNNLFCLDTGDSGAFVTTWAGFFDEKTKRLSFSNCGHFPALLIRSEGSVEPLTTRGMALGVEFFDHVDTTSVTLCPGDALLLFTDGVVEAYDDKKLMFGKERLLNAFLSRKHLPAQAIVDELVEELFLFTKGVPQQDDLTLLVLKVETSFS